MDLNFECRAVCDFPIPTQKFGVLLSNPSYFFSRVFFGGKGKTCWFLGLLSKKVWRAHKLLIGFQWFSRHKFFCKFKVASLTILTGCVVTTHPEKDFLKIDC